ncbi:MAG: protein-disulfide reductase DsbD family protein [Parahaliea sp.]
MRLVLASLFVLLSQLCFAQFDNASVNTDPFASLGEPEFLPVEEAFKLDFEVKDDGLRLYWLIADTYYLYQHAFKFKLSNTSGEIDTEIELPSAIERHDEFFGDTKVYYREADIRLRITGHSGLATLTVSAQGCADAGLCYPPRTQYFEVDFEQGTVTELDSKPQPVATSPQTVAPDNSILTILGMLALAFFGGSLLNLMPCVFPVLSLKVLSFAQTNEHTGHRQSWFYTAGVIVSFVGVAALLIGLQRAGQAIGWGFQLQSSGFVIALAYLFLAMGLALSGVIELGAGLMNSGSALANRQGDSGSFFTGVLAVVVASPCTAPLMGTALGFAITQPATIALLIFAALGAGMAAPLLLLAYSQLARRLLPAPGRWMDRLKQFLAFPLYASAIWLLWVAGRQAGVDTMAAALLGALFLALALWLWSHRLSGRITAALCLGIAVALALWQPGRIDDSQQTALSYGEPWSPAALAKARASGRPVFVDVTADWCITCIANERTVLNTETVRAAFETANVVYMVADWTRYDPEIANFLRQYGRNGIPFYIFYPADPAAEAIILPQILRSSLVLETLADTKNLKKAKLL